MNPEQVAATSGLPRITVIIGDEIIEAEPIEASGLGLRCKVPPGPHCIGGSVFVTQHQAKSRAEFWAAWKALQKPGEGLAWESGKPFDPTPRSGECSGHPVPGRACQPPGPHDLARGATGCIWCGEPIVAVAPRRRSWIVRKLRDALAWIVRRLGE